MEYSGFNREFHFLLKLTIQPEIKHNKAMIDFNNHLMIFKNWTDSESQYVINL